MPHSNVSGTNHMKGYRIQREEAPLAVLLMDEECFPHDHRASLDGAMWWLVLHGDDVVGYAGLRICEAPHNEGLGFLSRVGVMPKHRGKGLQKRLIRVREAAAKALGLRELVTYVVPWNSASLNSLVSCGYKFYRPGTKWGGAGAVYLRKRFGR